MSGRGYRPETEDAIAESLDRAANLRMTELSLDTKHDIAHAAALAELSDPEDPATWAEPRYGTNNNTTQEQGEQ